MKCWTGWSTSWNQDCWEKYQLPQTCRYLRHLIHHHYGTKWRGTKEHLVTVKEESEKVGLKLNTWKMKIMASGPITSWQIGKQWKQRQTLFSWAPKSLQMVTVCVCAQSYPTLCNPMECSPQGSSVHGIFQAIILEWVAISFSRMVNAAMKLKDSFGSWWWTGKPGIWQSMG